MGHFFVSRLRGRRARQSRSLLRIEQLEQRRLLASTATFASGLLTVTGDTAANSLTVTYSASGGNNYVVVKDGTTTIYDGVANSKLTSAVTSISLDAGTGNDTVTLTDVTTANGFTGLSGTAVTLQGNSGADTITGSSFNDSVLGGDGADSLVGGDGNDSLVGNQLNDTISGGNGNDTLQGATGDDSLVGGAGNDSYQYSRATTTDNLGSDTITEGTGGSNDSQDGVDFTVFLESVTINLTSTTVVSHADVTVTVNDSSALEAATGSSVADTITGNSRPGLLVGGAGNDTVTGGSSSDSIYGGSGDDSLVGGSGDDYIDGYTGNDTVKGEAGDDHYTFIRTGSENLGTDAFTETSANGTDGFDFTSINTGVTLDLSSSSSQTVASSVLILTLVNPTEFEWALGGTGNDSLTGNSAFVNLLCGGAGDDTLAGGSGDDIYYMTGSDLGTERITEASDGVDRDWLYFEEFTHAVTVDLSSTATQTVASGYLQLVLSSGTGIENVFGSVYADSLTGNTLDNQIEGTAGNDTLVGGTGSDTYTFFGTSLGSDSITEAADTDNDLIDLTNFGAAATIDISSTSLQTVSSGNLQLTLSSSAGIENVSGSVYGDVITGNSRSNVLLGGEGADSLAGSDGDDFLEGGAGNDTTTGGSGDDYYSYVGSVLGSDSLTETADTDADVLLFVQFSQSVTLDLSSTATQTVNSGDLQLTLSSATGIEWVQGSVYGDNITGNSRTNVLIGRDGNDTLVGGAGRDLIWGGDEYGGDGSDSLSGGDDDDILVSGFVDFRNTDFIAAIDDILTEWTSGHSYTDRVNNILGSGPSPIPSSSRLIGGTTVDDNDSNTDTLTGGAGSDWFLDDDGEDTLSDLGGSEQETDIG